MEEFVRSYGPWILLAAVFVAMHWFGAGCGGHRRGGEEPHGPGRQKDAPPPEGTRDCH